MFGISMEELLVIAVLAFILFGPQKLPEYAEKLGRIIAKIRAASTEVTQQFQNPFQYPPEPGNPATNPAEPGQPQQLQRADNFIICPSCEVSISNSDAFCPSCGESLKQEPPAARKPRQKKPASPPAEAKPPKPRRPRTKKPKEPEQPVVS